MSENDLQILVNGCRRGDRLSQKRVYQLFYRYGMNLCARYARTDEEAEEMYNDALVRAFQKIDLYDATRSFAGWLHTILVRASINYLRKFSTTPMTDDLQIIENQNLTAHFSHDFLADMSAAEIINLVRQLPPSYRAVFNLSVVDGHSHVEIAAMLGISEGTSRSNLMIARQKLQVLISESHKIRT